MKKSLLLVGGAILASVILSGCAGVSVPGATTAGPVFFADYSAPAVVNSYKGPCTIVKRGVTASATFKSFFTCINEGDVSYATLKKQALQQAQGLGEAYAIACSKDKNYTYIPKGYEIPTDLDYFHITTNNTIYGTEIKEDYDCPVPLIADMSSDIMSRPVDVSKYAMIYGGAQKNVGPAGVIFAIIRKDALGKVSRYIPTMLDYRTHIDKESMFNTPPVFAIYVMTETLRWLKSIGGVKAIQKLNQEKADLLYNEIDRNSMFVGTAAKEDRSLMNVCFVMAPGKEELQDEFFAFAKARGIVGIKGHRSVGGFRASLYNACKKEDVEALVDCMQEFEKLHK